MAITINLVRDWEDIQVFPEQRKYFIDKRTNRDWGFLQEQLSDNIGVASFTD